MLNVYLLRHGQTLWNAEGNKYCGRTDIPLTPLGIEQAGLAAGHLKEVKISQVYSSPLERARHTAEIAGGGLPVHTDPRLIEVDFGHWEGKTRAGFISEDPVLWDNWCRDPGTARAGGTGETALEVVRRVDDFFTEALREYARPEVAEPPGGAREQSLTRGAGAPAVGAGSGAAGPGAATNILVVGHNGINRLYLAWKLGMHLKDYRRLVQENSTITLFSLDTEAELTLKILNSR